MVASEALEILLKAVNVAQSKGAYSLADARVVADAVDALTKPDAPQTPEVSTENAPLPAKENEPAPAETKTE